MNSITQFLPAGLVQNAFFMAAVTLILGYFIAKVLSWVISSALGFLKLDSATASKLGFARGKVLQTSVAKMIFWIVMLFVFINVLQILGFDSAIKPIQGMLDQIMTFLPRLFLAGVILACAVFGSKIVKNILDSTFTAFDLDAKLGLHKLTGSSASVSRVITTTLSALVFLFILPLALDTLNAPSLSEPIKGIILAFTNFLPKLLGALIVMAVGLFIAKIVQGIIADLLKVGGVDQMPQKLGLASTNSFKGKSVSDIGGYAVFASIAVATISASVNILNVPFLSEIFVGINILFFKVLAAIIILLVGSIAANFAEKSLNSNKGVAKAAKIVILFLTGVMALDRLGIANSISSNGFLIIMSALGIAVGVGGAIAIGFGGRDAAARVLNKLIK